MIIKKEEEENNLYYEKVLFCDFITEEENTPKEIYLIIFSFLLINDCPLCVKENNSNGYFICKYHTDIYYNYKCFGKISLD